jgi:hypothetical protein
MAHLKARPFKALVMPIFPQPGSSGSNHGELPQRLKAAMI